MSIFFKNFGPYSKLRTANWPIAWRKQTQPYNKTCYRPVSVLTALSILYEVLFGQIYEAFYRRLSLNLSGFLKGHSCCTALLKLTEDWRACLDRREAVAAVNGQSYKCRLTWFVVALYTARICEFFVERLCSGLWSGSFSVFPPPIPIFLPSTVSSVWRVPGMGAHGWVAGICQPWG